MSNLFVETQVKVKENIKDIENLEMRRLASLECKIFFLVLNLLRLTKKIAKEKK